MAPGYADRPTIRFVNTYILVGIDEKADVHL